MSSYLNSLDYVVWFLFIVIELVLFLRLTDEWLKPVRWFMMYAVVRDLTLLTLTPKQFMYAYFMVYWISQMVSLIWFSYIATCILARTVKLPKPVQAAVPTLILGLCLMYSGYLRNLSIYSTPKLVVLQRECLAISCLILVASLIVQLSKINLALFGLVGTGLITVWVWEHFGYQPLVWETAWTFALIGVVFAVKKPLPASVIL